MSLSDSYGETLYKECQGRKPDIYQAACIKAATDFDISSNNKHIPISIKKISESLKNDNNQTQINLIHTIDEMIKTKNGEYFISLVEGNSMKNSGIYKGDSILCLKTEDIQSGDIIIVEINGKCLVKRYLQDRTGIYLDSENPDYTIYSIGSNDRFAILGKVVKLLKDVG